MRKNDNLVSIIIPVYNEQKYIGFCLSSLMKQTYNNLEILVVDDGSTDRSREIIGKYTVTLLEQHHQGPGIARNYGAKYARGNIFCFLDADMQYDTKYIENLVAPIIRQNVIGTFNKEELVANTQNVWSNCWAINSDLPINRHAPADIPDTQQIFRAIKRDAFMKAGGFNPIKGYFDDETLAQKLKVKAIAASGTIAYHFNPESLKEVYESARWIGRGIHSKKSLSNLLRYSPINSLRNGLRKVAHGAPLQYLLFKLIYDQGMFTGIFMKGKNNSK